MKKVIWLRDIPHIENPARENLTVENQAKAREILATKGLRFCNVTGRMYDQSGEIERYVDERAHVPHVDENAIMIWEFSRRINNAAGRIARGLPA